MYIAVKQMPYICNDGGNINYSLCNKDHYVHQIYQCTSYYYCKKPSACNKRGVTLLIIICFPSMPVSNPNTRYHPLQIQASDVTN